MRALGRIEGELKGINTTLADHGTKLTGIDGRLQKVEVKAAQHGAVAGVVSAVGISLVIEGLKRAISGHGA